MYLKDVEIFCEVVIRRSFSKAAEAFKLSQSSASHAVSTLERRIGKQLIDRSKRPLELTSAGQIYFEGCREMLRTFRAIEDRVQGVEDRVAGVVKVAAIYSVGLLQMEELIRRFEQAYPDVSVRVEYRHPDEVYEAVRTGKANVGLVSFPRDGGDFTSIPWQEQEMVVVVSPTHRFASRETLFVADLEGEDFVTFDAGLTVRRHIDRWLRSKGVAVNVTHAFDNVEHTKRAVEVGAGIALLPRPTVLREMGLGSLAAIPLADADWKRPLGIVHRRNKKLSTAARKFADALRSETGRSAEPVAAGEQSSAGIV